MNKCTRIVYLALIASFLSAGISIVVSAKLDHLHDQLDKLIEVMDGYTPTSVSLSNKINYPDALGYDGEGK